MATDKDRRGLSCSDVPVQRFALKLLPLGIGIRIGIGLALASCCRDRRVGVTRRGSALFGCWLPAVFHWFILGCCVLAVSLGSVLSQPRAVVAFSFSGP